MSLFGPTPPPRAQYKAPSSQSSGSSSESYDYSGYDDYQKKRDELQPLGASLFAQLYSGDVPASVTTSQRIRYLQDLLANFPTPFVRVSSESSSHSSSGDGPSYSYDASSDGPTPPAGLDGAARRAGNDDDLGRQLAANEMQEQRRQAALRKQQ